MIRLVAPFLLTLAIIVPGLFQSASAENPGIEVIAVVKLSGVLKDVDTIVVRCDASDESGEWIGRGLTYISTAGGVGPQTTDLDGRSIHLVDSLQDDLNEVVDVYIKPPVEDDINHKLYFWSKATCILDIVTIPEEDRGVMEPDDADLLVENNISNARTCNSIERGASAAACVARGTDPKLAQFEILRSELESSRATSND
jgi:hypothetical protein